MEWIKRRKRRSVSMILAAEPLIYPFSRAEKAKIERSTATETEINLPFVTADASGPKHLLMKLTKAKLEQLVGDLIEDTTGPCKNALADANLSSANIDEILLV